MSRNLKATIASAFAGASLAAIFASSSYAEPLRADRTAAVDDCASASHSCLQLTRCLGGQLPADVDCFEVSEARARELGVSK